MKTISVGAGTVFTADAQYGCGFLSAYAESNGSLRWRLASRFSNAAVYRSGTVFWNHAVDNGHEQLTAVDATTGKTRWSTGVDSRAVVAAASVVISGSTAFDARTGAVRWRHDDGNGWQAQTAIAGDVAYLNTHNTVQAVRITTGKVIWSYAKVNSVTRPGAGNASPAVHGGRVYIRSTFEETPGLVLDAATGRPVGTAPRSQSMVAFAGTAMVGTQSRWKNGATIDSLLRRVDATTGKTQWTQKLPRPAGAFGTAVLAPAPLISANTVWAVSVVNTGAPAKLVAYNLKTGAIRWSTTVRCSAAFDSDHGRGWSNLAIANGRIYVPTSCGLFAYRAAA